MRLLYVLLFALSLFPLSVTAEEHTVSSLVSYNSEQNSASGYGLIYQYKLIENFEFEAKYQQSGDLKLINADEIRYGDYSSFSTGINFTKQHHKNLTLKLGLGASLITSSSNNLLVEQDSIAPYFQIIANYKFTDDFSLSFGQSSQFNQAALGTNHSLFISFNWLFSSNTLELPKPNIHTDKTSIITSKKVIVPVKAQLQTIAQPADNSNSVSIPSWYVQVGAYLRSDNALQKKLSLQNSYPLSFNVLFYKNLHRVVSQSFPTKMAALHHLQFLKNKYKIQGFVNKI